MATRMDEGRNRNLVPALAIAAFAGVAITYFLTRRAKAGAESTVEKIVDLCHSAANKLDSMVSQAV